LLTFVVFPALVEATHLQFVQNYAKTEEDARTYENFVFQTAFSIFDTIGRYAAGVPCLILSRNKTLVAVYLRTVFLATLLLVSFDVTPSWLWGADWFKIVNYALFTFSNGYASSLCAVKAPETVATKDKGQVGSFVGTVIALGIVLGCTLALPFQYVVNLTPVGKEYANL
jgi:hypothetical protein